MNKVSPKGRIHGELNRLARRLVVECRDKNTCQRCGKTSAESQIHWAHVIGRLAKSIQWTPWNSLALCAGCHFWFDGDNRAKAREEWWAVKWPDRALQLQVWRSKKPRPIDLDLERAFLLQELDRFGRRAS